jgi:phosphopantetheine adenylyltransferase
MNGFEQFLAEAKGKPVVFTFGRFNPITSGHEIAINDIIKKAKSKGGTPFVFTSQTQDKKKNPLSYNDKTKFLKKFWGKMMIKDSKVRTAFEALKWLSDKGYTDVTMVVGSDRVAQFEKNIRPYIKHKDKSKSYEFDKFEVTQAGVARGKSNAMSATLMRGYATDGDLETFKTGVPSMANDKDAEELYNAVRKGLGIKEDKDTPFSDYLSEEITKVDLGQVEKFADKLFSQVGIDVEFTRHFLDRANDKRNGKDINVAELIRLFRLTYKKYGKKIPKMGPDAEAVLNDIQTDINLPFILKYDERSKEFDLVSKTVMRKKDFKTSDPKLKV